MCPARSNQQWQQRQNPTLPTINLTRGHQVAAQTIPEVMEDTVAMALQHLGMDVEAAVAQLRDFLGQQLHTIDTAHNSSAGEDVNHLQHNTAQLARSELFCNIKDSARSTCLNNKHLVSSTVTHLLQKMMD